MAQMMGYKIEIKSSIFIFLSQFYDSKSSFSLNAYA